MHYVIGDVHGQYSLLMMLFEKLNVDEDKDEVYFVGDFMERAPTREEQLETIKFYVEKFNNPNSCYKTVLGSHENVFIDRCIKFFESNQKENLLPEDVYRKEGVSICTIAEIENIKENEILCHKLVATILKQPMYYKLDLNDKEYFIMHSWLLDEHGRNCFDKPEESNRLKSMYDRSHSIFGHYEDNRILIHGHTPTTSDYVRVRGAESGKIWNCHNNVNVDCGAYHVKFGKGNLGAYCLETGECIYALTEEERWELCKRIFKILEDNENKILSEFDYRAFFSYLTPRRSWKDLKTVSCLDSYPLYQTALDRYLWEYKFLLPEYVKV